jgi:hypothetical protein
MQEGKTTINDMNFNLFRRNEIEAAVIVASMTPSAADIEKAVAQACRAQNYFLTQYGQLWITEMSIGALHIVLIANKELNDHTVSALFSSLPPQVFPVPLKDSLQA